MKRLSALIVSLLFASFSYGQDYSHLAGYQFQGGEDCREQATLVSEVAEYIIKTPLGGDDYTELNLIVATQYLINWMTVTPDVSFDISDNLMDSMSKNIEIVAVVFASMTKYAIDNNYNVDEYKMEETAITDAVKFYSDNRKHLKRDRTLEKYKKMIDDGTLENHLKK